MSQINQIIKVLSLTNSVKKEETINSIIEFLLFSFDAKMTIQQLKDAIKEQFLIELLVENLEKSLSSLIKLTSIFFEREGLYALSPNRKIEINNQYIKSKSDDEERFKRFSDFIDKISGENLTKEEKKKLSKVYTEYLYESFYEYGAEVINQFRPYKVNENTEFKTGQDSLIKSSIAKFKNQKLLKLFPMVIEEFPKFLSPEDLEYIESLTEKSECFFSLGLSKEMYDEIINLDIVNWKIFLDTNVIYGILGLNLEPDGGVCKKLIELRNKHNFNLEFYYFPHTLEELKKKRHYYEDIIPKNNFTPPHIRALIKSNQLDSFTLNYYQEKLKNPELPHPSDTIEYAHHILKSLSVNIYQSKFDELDERVDYITSQNVKFATYIRKINDVRKKNKQAEIDKSPDRILHDVVLRENILYLRSSNAVSLNDAKYFGLTLDKILLRFDQYENRQKFSKILVPTFFSPTFLFEKFLKLIPVTDDHKNAFISAIASQAFERNHKNSITVQKTVKYFHSIGIENEKLILECISDEYFLSEFKRKDGTPELDQFVQSEVESFIKRIASEKAKLEEDVKKNSEKLTQNIKYSQEKDILLDEKEGKIRELSEKLQNFINELEIIKTNSETQNKTRNSTNTLSIIAELRADNSQKFISINWNVLKKFANNIWKKLHTVIIALNVFLCLILILTSIIVKKYDTYALIGIFAFGMFAPREKVKKWVSFFILIIVTFFILFNINDLKNIWSNFITNTFFK